MMNEYYDKHNLRNLIDVRNRDSRIQPLVELMQEFKEFMSASLSAPFNMDWAVRKNEPQSFHSTSWHTDGNHYGEYGEEEEEEEGYWPERTMIVSLTDDAANTRVAPRTLKEWKSDQRSGNLNSVCDGIESDLESRKEKCGYTNKGSATYFTNDICHRVPRANEYGNLPLRFLIVVRIAVSKDIAPRAEEEALNRWSRMMSSRN
jgi:hypothetical protein